MQCGRNIETATPPKPLQYHEQHGWWLTSKKTFNFDLLIFKACLVLDHDPCNRPNYLLLPTRFDEVSGTSVDHAIVEGLEVCWLHLL